MSVHRDCLRCHRPVEGKVNVAGRLVFECEFCFLLLHLTGFGKAERRNKKKADKETAFREYQMQLLTALVKKNPEEWSAERLCSAKANISGLETTAKELQSAAKWIEKLKKLK